MKNTRATLAGYSVIKPDAQGPVTTLKLRMRLTADQVAELHDLLMVEHGALDVEIVSKQAAFA